MPPGRHTAPIALFAYNRPEHLLRTLSSLRADRLAGESDLFVISDGPRDTADAERVAEVRRVLADVGGFRSVSIDERPINLGLAASIIDGVTRIVSDHGRIVVLEDDMVTSQWFLTYMNDALDLYEDDERVISVSGYCFPIAAQLPATFFRRGADCWGWGTWARGWELFEPDGGLLLSELRRRDLEWAFDLEGAYPHTAMLEEQIRRENNSWAIRWQASAELANKVTVYPGQTLLCNIGHGGSGTHSGTTTLFGDESGVTPEPVPVQPVPMNEDPEIHEAHRRYFVRMHAGPPRSVAQRLRQPSPRTRSTCAAAGPTSRRPGGCSAGTRRSPCTRASPGRPSGSASRWPA